MCTVELEQQIWGVLLCVKALLVLLHDKREGSCKNLQYCTCVDTKDYKKIL